MSKPPMPRKETKLFVVITVDVEDSQGLRTLYDDTVDELSPMIYGHMGTQTVGLPTIIEMCDRFGAKATFFVNVFESAKYGERAFQDICSLIASANHDVQLHTHPARGYDKKRESMNQYSLAEQTAIIRDGIGLIQKWTGRRPVAHRAGAYGLNAHTIDALRVNGIKIDSSMYYGHPNCKLTWTRNKITSRNQILEIPITGFMRRQSLKFAGFNAITTTRFVKTDINAASLDELTFFIEEAKKHNIRLMNLFLHSYSFVTFSNNFTEFSINSEDMDKFRQILQIISKDRDIEIMTVDDINKLYRIDPKALDGSDEVPVYDYEASLVRFGLHKVRRVAARAKEAIKLSRIGRDFNDELIKR